MTIFPLLNSVNSIAFAMLVGIVSALFSNLLILLIAGFKGVFNINLLLCNTYKKIYEICVIDSLYYSELSSNNIIQFLCTFITGLLYIVYSYIFYDGLYRLHPIIIILITLHIFKIFLSKWLLGFYNHFFAKLYAALLYVVLKIPKKISKFLKHKT